MSTQEQRERFEKYAISAGWAYINRDGLLCGFGRYDLYQLWEAWQAAESDKIDRYSDLIKSAYLLGWNSSGEGWNAEYGCYDPESDKNWLKVRDGNLRALLPKEE